MKKFLIIGIIFIIGIGGFLIFKPTQKLGGVNDRYWVGGTGNWSDATNHWAFTSGGLPNILAIPDSETNCVIDDQSGLSGGTITLDGNVNCLDFTSNSGLNYTLDGDSNYHINVYGSLTLETGIALVNLPDGLASFRATSTGKTITTAGKDLTYIDFVGIGGGWTLQDNLTIGQFYQENGTFDANDFNVTANDFYFYADTGYTPTVVMGSGTWGATGNDIDVWYIDEYSNEVVTIIPETSTIKISGEEAVGFRGGGKTYNNLWFSNSIYGGQISFSSTFNDLKISAGARILFEAGTTQTVSSFTAIGTVGNLITLQSTDDTTPTQFTLSKASGVVECDYLDISNSNATGGATWYAGANSVDTTNNDGWIFGGGPPPTTGKKVLPPIIITDD